MALSTGYHDAAITKEDKMASRTYAKPAAFSEGYTYWHGADVLSEALPQNSIESVG